MDTRLTKLSGRWRRIALGLLACAALAACQSSTDLSGTANVPTQYSHVWVTLARVAFNTSATAGPTDTGWQEFTLSTPQTIDLTSVTNGTLSQFASSLSLPAGTYNQMRVVLVDSNAPLASAAHSAGALYNDEVDTTGTSGAEERLPLAVPNAVQGITFAINLTIRKAQQAALAALACGESSSAGATGSSTASTCEYGTETSSECTAGTIYDSIIGTCIAIGNTSDTVTGTTTTTSASTCAAGTTYDSSTGACISTGTTTSANCSYNEVYDPTNGTCTSSGLGSATTSYAAINFDASRDLVPYTINGQSGFLLIPHLTGIDLAQAGTIEGQVDLSGLPSTGAGGIEVTAETPSSDGTRYVAVESAPLESDGSFVLYPLPCTSGSTSSSSSSSSSSTAVTTCAGSSQDYDLVIHGPAIETAIIQSVPVTAGPPSSATALSLGVSLTAATSYTVNLSSAVSPPGAWIGFYQELPDSSSASLPYLIEARPVDPFTGTFDTAQSLSAGSLEYEVYAAGGLSALTPVTPAEGTSTYQVAASAPLYGAGALSTTVSPPSSGSTATASFTAAAIPLPSGMAAETISGTVSVASPGKYNEGELVLTQDGALVAVSPLGAYLGSPQTAATLFTSVPGGTSTSVYYAEAWVWNSSDPAGSLARQPQSAPIDLSSGSASNVAITIQ